MRAGRVLRPAALVLAIAGVGACRGTTSAPERTALVAIYMVGGSLEDRAIVRGSWKLDEGDHLPPGELSPFGAASDDLRELVNGYDSLGPAERRQVTIWAAFGGANKAGWRGVRYADAECLSADAEDEIFGNADCYAYRDPEANMASRDSLHRFLGFLQPARQNTLRTVLVFWGQGGAFRGALHDTVQQEIPLLPLKDLADAFSASARPFNIIGFDAGLMASLEVAHALRPHGKLLVASTDLVPRHGWDYAKLVRSVTAARGGPVAIARDIADAFIEGQSTWLDPTTRRRAVVSHRTTRGKTVSVIDTAATDGVLAQLSRFGKAAARPEVAVAAVLGAFDESPAFGRDLRTAESYVVDLRAAMERVGQRVPALAEPAGAVAREVARAVLHTRHDEEHPATGGLTAFSPTSNYLWTRWVKGTAPLAPPWRSFLDSLEARRHPEAMSIMAQSDAQGGATLVRHVRGDVIRVREIHGERSDSAGTLRVWRDRQQPIEWSPNAQPSCASAPMTQK